MQGVGFRPFVARLARECGVVGTVRNGPDGVVVDAFAGDEELGAFEARLRTQRPPAARVDTVAVTPIGAGGAPPSFRIASSQDRQPGPALGLPIGPDLATCEDCLAELFDPSDRRHRYPFINCTSCGPRYTIATAAPYDRVRTTMAGFSLCEACASEFEDPEDRRHHAQPNACPVCGPTLGYRGADGRVLCEGNDGSLEAAARALRAGRIVAVLGLGGFHLMVDARSEAAVQRLRARKSRGSKAFAVMFRTLEHVHAELGPGAVDGREAEALGGPAAPIVLARVGRSARGGLAPSVAPASADLGVMLASNPIQHLLLDRCGGPLVATSGNRSEEPLATTLDAALRSWGELADGFLVHDRPIARPVDDSIVRVVPGLERPLTLRRARGFAPLGFELGGDSKTVDLALGAHAKSTLGLRAGGRAVLSPHIGDLGSLATREHFARVEDDLGELLRARPDRAIVDRHPDYASTARGEDSGLPLLRVQHHRAHALGAAQELGLLGRPHAAIVWDGSGFGDDGTSWGGEAFAGPSLERRCSFGTFPLPGGERAVREPWRAALGLLSLLPEDGPLTVRAVERLRASSGVERSLFDGVRKLARGGRAPRCSSVGRLFDGVAALLGLCQRMDYEAEAAMAVELAAEGGRPPEDTSVGLLERGDDGVARVRTETLVTSLLLRHERGATAADVAAGLHVALARCAVRFAEEIAAPDVLLTGGCFQNRSLLIHTRRALERAGFRVHIPADVPMNDGGIAFGQLVAGAALPSTPTES